MLGAIIGDIAGSRFEWNNIKTKEFELLAPQCRMTDDSMMTLAVAGAILECGRKIGDSDSGDRYENPDGNCGIDHCGGVNLENRNIISDDGYSLDLEQLSGAAIKWMQKLGRRHPEAGYGRGFFAWFNSEDPRPYNSFGNGAAMRVSPCGFAAGSLKEAALLSEKVTAVSHNHPKGIKAAEAVSAAVFMARNGSSIEEIRKYITGKYYSINFTLDEIRFRYSFDVSCQGSVPQAFEAFFESNGFEDAIRNAISIGGDSDTIAAIAGGMAEAYYGIPDELRIKALTYFKDKELVQVLEAFEVRYGKVSEHF